MLDLFFKIFHPPFLKSQMVCPKSPYSRINLKAKRTNMNVATVSNLDIPGIFAEPSCEGTVRPAWQYLHNLHYSLSSKDQKFNKVIDRFIHIFLSTGFLEPLWSGQRSRLFPGVCQICEAFSRPWYTKNCVKSQLLNTQTTTSLQQFLHLTH